MDKNLDERRHSLAHLLAAAVLELYPDAKPTIGPAIENGFYYDFDNIKISDSDLPKIEKKMKKLLPSWKDFEGKEVSSDEAREYFKDNSFKLELVDELEKEGSTITFYTSGDFTDLCRGGHVDNPAKDLDKDAFTLSHTAGAYWRGDETNQMLTRIYGLAFESKEGLEKHLAMREEAEKRDHRKIGKEMDLFVFSELVGPGLPMWSPKGTLLRDLLDDFVWKLRSEHGYERVDIPHLTKKDLYEKSGHWDKFGDELFKATTREGHEFVVKPMNCPHHTQIFDRKQHSYREMPQRYASTTKVYRDEQTGELAGLSRVRAITQDDAHVFCRENQVKEEAFKIWDIIETFYGAFGFEMNISLSTHDPENMDAFLGDIETWENAVSNMKEWLKERNVDFTEGVGDAAFYGPKIDFIAKDSLGRKWQVATLQVDRNMPERFDLTCVNEKGEKERVVMLHAAIMGSLERFVSILIEHTAGAFPFWLSPVQTVILPISDDQKTYAQEVAIQLREVGFRVDVDESNETLGKKIREWKLSKIPYALVIGEKEVKDNVVTVESRDRGNQGQLPLEKIIENFNKGIEKRS